eukprot:scaffold9351_cov55-Attheya_sp.AAC.2
MRETARTIGCSYYRKMTNVNIPTPKALHDTLSGLPHELNPTDRYGYNDAMLQADICKLEQEAAKYAGY